MEKPNLTQLKELLAKGTPGPWRTSEGRGIEAAWETHEVLQIVSLNHTHWSTDPRSDDVELNRKRNKRINAESEANGELICAAVNALPSLLAEREALREALRQVNDLQHRMAIELEPIPQQPRVEHWTRQMEEVICAALATRCFFSKAQSMKPGRERSAL